MKKLKSFTQILILLLISTQVNAAINRQEKNGFIAYIQTHNFSLTPIAISAKGYALFITSNQLQATDKVTIQAPKEAAFPDSKSFQKELNSFEPRGEFSQISADRIQTAMGGELKEGDYTFQVVHKNVSEANDVTIQYKKYFLEPASDISVSRKKDNILFFWKSPKQADSFLVFLLPKGFKDFAKELVSISHSDHRGAQLVLKKEIVPKGEYWVLVRSNQHLENGLLGYISESWGISKKPFLF